jgi:predicted nucleic acid-binding protein
MPGEASAILVVDASVAAKLWFDEGDAALAEAALSSGERLIAPALFHVEIASVASQRVRRGLSSDQEADQALAQSKRLLDEVFPTVDLVNRAFELARDHAFSVYDGLYVALAERERAVVLTADLKLVNKAGAAGLSDLVRRLGA